MTPADVRENGPLARVVVPVPQGQGYLLLRFEDTPLRAMSKLITLAVILGLVFLIVGVVLTATVVGAIVGIPFIIFGLLLMVRGLF